MRQVALVLVAVALAVSCSSGGDDRPSVGSAPSTTVLEQLAGTDTTLTSPDFADGGAIPVVHSGCDGDNVAPTLEWSGVTGDAEQLAVTMVDPDAGGFVHWVVAGLDPGATGLASGELPAGATEALNGTGEVGYFGPCPPEHHRYVFTLHALSADPGVTEATTGEDAMEAIEDVTTIGVELSGTYAPES